VRRALTPLLAALALAGGAAAGCGGRDDAVAPGEPVAGGRPDAPAPVRERTVERVVTRVETVEESGRAQGFSAQRIFRRDGPGVVTIISVFPDGEAQERDGGASGLGSGFVLNEQGEIATNAHVVTQGEGAAIRRAREVFVRFADDNQVPARIIGVDPNADVALLRLESTAGLTLRPIGLGQSSDVRVGASVAAIGSPFGEEQSLSVGVVSATDRAIRSLTGFQTLGAVQTDAAINQGNSGGPLIDADGEVIGINAQIRTNSGGGEGVGYAIPVDQVRRSLEQIRARGEVRYAYLGVSTAAVYPQLGERFDLGTDQGAWVQEVNEGGPGDEAGLRAGEGEERFQAREYTVDGDVIIRVDDTPIRTENDLGLTLTRYEPGTEVTLTVLREGEREELRVRLGERPASVEPRRP